MQVMGKDPIKNLSEIIIRNELFNVGHKLQDITKTIHILFGSDCIVHDNIIILLDKINLARMNVDLATSRTDFINKLPPMNIIHVSEIEKRADDELD